jgi:RNA polymerase sigma factor (sigma-70 family)
MFDDGPLVVDLEGLWRTRRSGLVATVAAVVGDRDVAADAVDEAFVRAFARRRRVEAMAAPAAWILRVAINVARKRRFRSHRREQAEAAAASRSAAWIEPADPRHELWSAVAGLPVRERTAVALRYLADLTEPQIGEVMGIAPGTVGASLTSARRKLAVALGAGPDGEEQDRG